MVTVSLLPTEKFAQEVHSIFVNADVRAKAYNRGFITTGDILFSILMHPESRAVNALKLMDISPQKIRGALEEQSETVEKSSREDAKLSTHAHSAITFAEDLARVLKEETISSPHILLGLRHGDGSASRALAFAGVEFEVLRILLIEGVKLLLIIQRIPQETRNSLANAFAEWSNHLRAIEEADPEVAETFPPDSICALSKLLRSTR